MLSIRSDHATRNWVGLLCAGLLVALSGCSKPPAPVSQTRLYAIDQTGEAARCSVQPVTMKPGAMVSTKMLVANNGGWCGISLVQPDGGAFAVGLVKDAPLHGKIYIHTVGDATRVDYTPSAYFHGTDHFTIRLLPGEGMLTVAVTVTPQ